MMNTFKHHVYISLKQNHFGVKSPILSVELNPNTYILVRGQTLNYKQQSVTYSGNLIKVQSV